MAHDDQIPTALGTALRAELADVHAAPGLAEKVRRRHSRQRMLQASVGVPAIAAAAALTVALTGIANPGGPQAGGLQNVVYVTSHADTALAGVSGYVLKATSENVAYAGKAGSKVLTKLPGAPTERISWTDPVTGRTRTDDNAADGTPQISESRSGAVSREQTTRFVNHFNRTWWQGKHPADPEGGTTGVDEFTYPAQIRAALKSGAWQVVADGGPGIAHLRRMESATPDSSRLDLWVDARTFLPSRLLRTIDSAPFDTHYTWVPRTAENLAKTELTPPAGYQQVAAPKTATLKPTGN